MTKAFEFNWRRPVPLELLNGNLFDVWEEVFIGSKVQLLAIDLKFIGSTFFSIGKRRNHLRSGCFCSS